MANRVDYKKELDICLNDLANVDVTGQAGLCGVFRRLVRVAENGYSKEAVAAVEKGLSSSENGAISLASGYRVLSDIVEADPSCAKAAVEAMAAGVYNAYDEKTKKSKINTESTLMQAKKAFDDIVAINPADAKAAYDKCDTYPKYKKLLEQRTSQLVAIKQKQMTR